MALNTLLCFVLIGGALILIFKSGETKVAQYMAIAVAVIGAVSFFQFTGKLHLRFGGDSTMIILSGAAAVLSLICYVRLNEKSFAMLLIAASVILLLIELQIVRSLN